jgi:hypothetical protein
MAYDLHITRRQYWASEDGPSIGLAEWAQYVAMDPDVVPDPQNNEEDYIYSGHPTSPWPILWSRGDLLVGSADDAMLAKALAIAARLDARVLGDDDEQYLSVGTPPTPAI